MKQTTHPGGRALSRRPPRAAAVTQRPVHTTEAFQAGNREASPPVGSGPDPQETFLLIRLPLSPGLNFPSFIPTHTPGHSNKRRDRGLFKQTDPPTTTVGNYKAHANHQPRLFLGIKQLPFESPGRIL